MTDDVPRPFLRPTELLARPRPMEHAASGLRAQRRRRLAEAFPGELLVVPTGSAKVRANDTTYPFRPGTAFTWLVGSQARDAVLVLHPDGQPVLYQPAPQSTWLDEGRLVKDAWEVEQLQDAVDATVRGFEDVVRDLDKAVATSERYLEGRFFLRARVDGNDVGYGSICASGANACTLHHVRNDSAVSPGDLLLLDMGVENRELYTADITRTLPVSGRFTERQRWMYSLVYEAQEAALAELRPGVAYDVPYDAAMAVLVRGLRELGLVESDDVLDKEDQRHRRWTAHRISHMLGLDVHDCAAAREELYAAGVYQEGMVITVEPGLYFQQDDALVPEDLRGTGVRIEDDVRSRQTAVGSSVPPCPAIRTRSRPGWRGCAETSQVRHVDRSRQSRTQYGVQLALDLVAEHDRSAELRAATRNGHGTLVPRGGVLRRLA